MKDITKIIAYLFLAVLMIFIGPLIIKITWNYLMPVIFGLPTITWLQGLAMSVLFGCLFKVGDISLLDKSSNDFKDVLEK